MGTGERSRANRVIGCNHKNFHSLVFDVKGEILYEIRGSRKPSEANFSGNLPSGNRTHQGDILFFLLNQGVSIL